MKDAIKTQLYSQHVKQGAKLVPFGGYLLPVWYEGLKQEHDAVRTSCGAFDISHMGLFELSGPDAGALLQSLTCNDVDKADKGIMVYSMMLNENGGILDDIMFGKLAESSYLVVVNAGNRSKIWDWITQTINASTSKNVTLTELNKEYSFIAVQGPKAQEKLANILPLPFNDYKRFSLQKATLWNEEILILGTGYTGEAGFELAIPHTVIEKAWSTLMDNGITPCGLGARDSLRLEAGLPLYGQELSENITPLHTRYNWVVSWNKNFKGKAALETLKNTSVDMATVGIEMEERIIPRTHYIIEEGGEVTSGTLSPSLDKPIGMAIINKENAKEGQVIHVQIRGKSYPAKVVPLPFYGKK